MNQIIIGQRYISVAEPELGLGIVSELEDKLLTLAYPATEEIRRYSVKTAPLKRIEFTPGDDLTSNDGRQITIKEVVKNEDGLLVYRDEKTDNHIIECDILDTLSFHRPHDKLLNALPDNSALFQLRYETFKHKSWLATHPARGFIGGRLSLIEHQFYLANKVTERLNPRVLLADEVGLGKTIEAGLILHKLIITGRVQRVLIVTPNTLNYQWFIEMLRKYNLSFNVINEQTTLEPETNPFDENNLIITSMELLCGSSIAEEMVMETHFDLLIVDEAHKLHWKKTGPSNQYTKISKLAEQIKGLLLLTATPEIYGLEGHFSHLKLIDPDRFHDFDSYAKEQVNFSKIAKEGQKLLESSDMDSAHEKVAHLIDRHGPGRVYFRNIREVLDKEHRFFPIRTLRAYAVEDKLIHWLIEFLKSHREQKVLLICNSKEKVLKIEKDLKKESAGNKVSVFHEDLSLLARDRNAAYFRDPDGANLLLCSEIGSEGRNFQFCQHLVLLDLPKNPDLLEQRIGRLDRIGQKEEIFIHVPYRKNSSEEVLFHWHNQVFNAFTHSTKGAAQINELYLSELGDCLENPNEALKGEKLPKIIKEAQKNFTELNQQLQEGRDILIELNSFNKTIAKKIIKEVVDVDQSDVLRKYLDNIYTLFGIDVENLDENSQYIKPNVNMYISHFPYLDEDGFSYTFDRQVALEREELDFMTWDHPMVVGIMDLIIGEEDGNSTLMVRKNGQVKHFLETFYLQEAIAPKSFEVERFFPPTIIRVLVDFNGQDFSEKWDKALLDDKLEDAPKPIINQASKFPKKDILALLKTTKEIAEKKHQYNIKKYEEKSIRFYNAEIDRLKALQKVNSAVSQLEVDALILKRDQINSYIQKASLGLDSIRVIF